MLLPEATDADVSSKPRRLQEELAGVLQRFAALASMAFGVGEIFGICAVGGRCPLSRRPVRNCWLTFAVPRPCGRAYGLQREAQIRDSAGNPLATVRTCALANRAAAASAWTEAVREAVSGIVRREAILLRRQEDLSAAKDELTLAYGLTGSLRGLGQEREVGERVVEHIAEVLPADAVALLAGGEHGAFPRVLAACGLSDDELVKVAARCGWLIHTRMSQLSRGAPVMVPAADVGLMTWTGPAVVTVAATGPNSLAALMAARQTPENSFEVRELRLAAMAVRHAALALSSIALRDRLHSLFMSTVRALAAAVDAKDPYTRGHSQRVAALAVAVGQAVGLSEGELENLQLAGLMHDLGKIGVHSGILLKPGALESHEWEAVKLHPSRGAEILGCIPELDEIVDAVKYHHERLDGSGYPEGLRGKEIPLFARIIAVCDAFDAMTSERPYRPPMTPDEAIAELRAASKQYDQRLVEVLAAVLEGHPENASKADRIAA